ncbi:TAP-like protein-domain-containing protein [Emericellopsis atlantica]|uniref:TAP-like protein-domain-containing protein n=1 Tax=Emericellopsis atlantica TaxID=2614577 RepID=A0A9P7ZLA0_9HYPO|nr:TAP-like protein-domain-containing protein [Emericellopsis atlantica]KAG9253792.1 TAP-like protein-domain-containing protein [Emericellopsis atlantica]
MRSLVLALAGAATTALAQSFDFTTLEPSEDLEWTPCLEIYECARLEMPLDWTNESDSRTVAIAMMKLPAVVDVDDPAWAGPIFTNPGGPGHSGVDFVLSSSARLQAAVDKPGEKHYEIVSFDPRGIASSTPTVDCFGSLLERDAFFLELRGSQGLVAGERAIKYDLALFEGMGKLCQSKYDNGLEIFPYIGTASVVEDMVRMVDKSDEWRQSQQKKRGLEVRETEEKPRLKFMGFSYGTVLAQFFASIHPERVGRVLADGVVNVHDYATGPGWLTAGLDTDSVFDHFVDLCWEAEDRCRLYRSDSSADDMKKTLRDLIARLDVDPMGALAPDGKRVVVRGDDFREAFGVYSYNGITGFASLAVVFDAALQGDFSYLITFLKTVRTIPTVEDGCPNENGTKLVLSPPENLYSVMCLDGSDVRGKDSDYWVDYVNDMKDVSEIYGATLALIRFGCSHWPFRAENRFDGPFKTPKADKDDPSTPAAPLMFMGNQYDPVTPIRNAENMAKDHPGAGVLIQESTGHCALLVATSNCTSQAVAEYFDTGKVPEDILTCEESCHPWDAGCGVNGPGTGPGAGNGTGTAAVAKRGEMGFMEMLPRGHGFFNIRY